MEHKTRYEKANEQIEWARAEEDPVIRDLRLRAAERYLHADSFADLQAIIQELYMGDKNIVTGGQVGAMGSGANAQNNTFTQINAQDTSNIDLTALARQLSEFAESIRSEASQQDHFEALVALKKAQAAAETNNREATFQRLAEVGTWALTEADKRGAGPVAEAISLSSPELASYYSTLKYIPWANLDPEEFTIARARLDTHVGDDVRRYLRKYGIALVRIDGRPATEEMIRELGKFVGPPCTRQNQFYGEVKTIDPKPEITPTTGDSAQNLGFHVDGTQHDVTPAVLSFQYVVDAELGAQSVFVDFAKVLLDIEETRRNQILINLARHDAAFFSKSDMEFRGPIISLTDKENVKVRIRFDDVIQVHDACTEDFKYLEERLNDNKYRIRFKPQEADMIVFDNWRVLHARDAIYGEPVRKHRRMWFPNFEPYLRDQFQLGIREIPVEVRAEIKRANDQN